MQSIDQNLKHLIDKAREYGYLGKYADAVNKYTEAVKVLKENPKYMQGDLDYKNKLQIVIQELEQEKATCSELNSLIQYGAVQVKEAVTNHDRDNLNGRNKNLNVGNGADKPAQNKAKIGKDPDEWSPPPPRKSPKITPRVTTPQK